MAGNKKRPLPPWATTIQGTKNDSYVRISDSLWENENYQKLSFSAKHIYLLMGRVSDYARNRGLAEFTFPRAVYYGKYKIPPATFNKAFKELEGKFVECTFRGKNQRQASKYKMVNRWKCDG
ncbi:hypothetical protein [uncultured Acidaminococcus sp.]|uniref:hypothetical protein n=1 Tax=uncultured Acidaminococcus sp. TaxID=352152 RepID=UPI0026DAD4DC|nr:hypothetical protein [uncultured Acidaminococcus sp.]